MSKSNFLFSMLVLSGLVILLTSADHIDAPAVSGTTADIGDLYAFQSKENSANMVLVVTMQGLMSPMTTETATFDENVLTEINIDNDGDAVEDLVIQLIPRDGKMYAFGPVSPSSAGTKSTILSEANSIEVAITDYGSQAIIAQKDGKSLFAGSRDDPFFFDLGKYGQIIAGGATGFDNPGTDALAGTNIMSIAIEVPKSSLGSGETINTWVESKTK